MDVFEMLGKIIQECVVLMSNCKVMGNVSWWDVSLAFMALSVGVFLFRLFFGSGGQKE